MPDVRRVPHLVVSLFRPACIVAFAILPTTTDAQTGCFSELPDCIRVAPDGGIPFSGRIIHINTCEPVPDTMVRLIFNAACENLRACPDANTPPTFVLPGMTDGDGFFTLFPAIGGCCVAAGAAELHADPGDVTQFPIYEEVGSPDNGGDGRPGADLVVNLPDFSRFSAAFLTEDACHDFSLNPDADDYCDGEVKLADFAIFSSFFLSACE